MNDITPNSRPDAWNGNAAHTHVNYRIVAEAEPDVLCRVLNHFAQQFLTPQRVSVTQQDSLLFIEVHQGQLSAHRAGVIAAKLRGLVSVCSVALEDLAQPHAEVFEGRHALQIMAG